MKILVAIPAYNEENTIYSVIEGVRKALPEVPIAVVDDGSVDKTAAIVRQTDAVLLSLPCNLGYSNAVETLLTYAYRENYDAIALIDADGQHDPACLPEFISAFEVHGCDMLIGSRYVEARSYRGNPLGRQIGMAFFSLLTSVLLSTRIYDTTSGMKAIRRNAMEALLLGGNFIDFHAEAIIYLLNYEFIIQEYPITVKERQYGVSMYSFLSHLWYPLTVLLVIAINFTRPRVMKKGAKGL
jgi:glycosyltransferase involved in cell wall biosynthesis